MKKLLPILMMLFAFSFGANAQQSKERKPFPEEKAKQETFELTKVIEVDGATQQALFQLFLKKHKDLDNETVKFTEADKQQLSSIIDAKLRATLSDDQIQKLQSVGLYEKLIH
ncbi:hypothetical protein [Flavobacterium sp.]|uniref:hypothetical protein n=1 Tax=Flavobacterium sp. TaxID=239 RepID=UPI003D6A5B45